MTCQTYIDSVTGTEGLEVPACTRPSYSPLLAAHQPLIAICRRGSFCLEMKGCGLRLVCCEMARDVGEHVKRSVTNSLSTQSEM